MLAPTRNASANYFRSDLSLHGINADFYPRLRALSQSNQTTGILALNECIHLRPEGLCVI